LPSDPYDRARVRLWIDHIGKAILPAQFRLLQAQEADAQNRALEELYEGLRKFAKEIQGPYFLGEDFTLVDIAIVPWIVRDHIIADHRGFKRSGVSDNWERYCEISLKRPTVLKTQSLDEHYTEIYGRYLRDEAQSEAAKATRAGRAIP